MTSEHYDVVIVGAGPGGYTVALRSAELGKSVLLVERDDVVGGTCLNRGCIPSKALITATRTIDTIHRGEQIGIDCQLQEIDFGKLCAFRDDTVSTMRGGLLGLLTFRGVHMVQGIASIEEDGHVRVVPAQGEKTVRGRNAGGDFEDGEQSLDVTAGDVVIATGSRPKPLDVAPFNHALIDSTAALALNSFPHSAVVIGSGATALEFATMWNSAGADVTLIMRGGIVLSRSDRRAAKVLMRELKRQGITIVTKATITAVDTGENLGATVHYMDADGNGQEVFAEWVLAAIGRVPNTDGAWFEKASIELDENGLVQTDAYGRTSREHVWALGDITPGHQLAHRAYQQGYVVAESIAGLDPSPVNEHTIPTVVFSNPEFASVGYTLREAKADPRFADVSETLIPVMANARMLMSGASGSVSVVSGRKSADQSDDVHVLGVHIVSPDASDLIAETQQIIGNHVPLSAAARNIHPHPTFSEMLGETLLKADGRPLHTR